MINNRIYQFISLCKKAGKLFSGDETCEKLIKSLRADLVIVAEDASENTIKKFTNMCNFREVTLRFYGTKELLGRFTGKEIRAVLVINDKGCANKLLEMIDSSKMISGGEINGES